MSEVGSEKLDSEELKRLQKSAKSVLENSKINGELRAIYDELNKII